MTTYKLTRDTNGNKCLSVRVPGYRAFSIQTNGNLPSTDRNGVCSATASEVSEYVRRYGTSRQKELLGMAATLPDYVRRVHPSGMFEIYSRKQGRFLQFDELDSAITAYLEDNQ